MSTTRRLAAILAADVVGYSPFNKLCRSNSSPQMEGFVDVAVIARSDSDEAIHAPASGAMDCFASLAMTKTQFRMRLIDPTGKSPKVCPVLGVKIFRFARRANHL